MSFMRDNTLVEDEWGDATLYDITFPAAHDAGCYTFQTDDYWKGKVSVVFLI